MAPMNEIKWNFNQNTKRFIHENASENIVNEMAAINSTMKPEQTADNLQTTFPNAHF